MAAIDNFSDVSTPAESAEAAELSTSFLTYIRPVDLGEEMGYAVCTEDGIQLAVFGSEEAAYFSARQHNLTPVSVH